MTIIDLLNLEEYLYLIDIEFKKFMKLNPSEKEQTAFVNGFNKAFLAIKNNLNNEKRI